MKYSMNIMLLESTALPYEFTAFLTVEWLCKCVGGKKFYITSHILLHEFCFGKSYHSEKSQISAFC